MPVPQVYLDGNEFKQVMRFIDPDQSGTISRTEWCAEDARARPRTVRLRLPHTACSSRRGAQKSTPAQYKKCRCDFVVAVGSDMAAGQWHNVLAEDKIRNKIRAGCIR